MGVNEYGLRPVGISITGLVLLGWICDYKLGAFPPWMGRVRVGYSFLRKGYSRFGLTPHPSPLPEERELALKSLTGLILSQQTGTM